MFHLPSLQLRPLLLKMTIPHRLLWQRRMIGNVAALTELDDFALSMLFLHNSKRSVREVHLTLGSSLEAAGPAHRVHEATLVTIAVGNAQGVGEAVLEGHKCPR